MHPLGRREALQACVAGVSAPAFVERTPNQAREMLASDCGRGPEKRLLLILKSPSIARPPQLRRDHDREVIVGEPQVCETREAAEFLRD